MDVACEKAAALAANAKLVRRMGPAEHEDQAIHAIAELLRGHQGADLCAIVLHESGSEKASVYCADHDPEGASAQGMDADAARLLLAQSSEELIFHGQALRSAKCVRPDRLARIARLLQAGAFISLPLRVRQRCLGRVYLAWRRAGDGANEAGGVVPLARQAAAMIDDLRIVRRLETQAAWDERRRISRDLHDSTIQPYVGLKLGMEALRRKVQREAHLVREVEELINMASDGIGDLREYVGRLKRVEAPKKHADLLVPAVRRQAQKFTDFYGIKTRVVATRDIPVTAALHDQIIHIVREGLSNIRRHTSATKASVRLREAQGRLVLELINDNPGREGGRHDFFPRSIGERAQELGGRLRIERLGGRRTLVAVELPL